MQTQDSPKSERSCSKEAVKNAQKSPATSKNSASGSRSRSSKSDEMSKKSEDSSMASSQEAAIKPAKSAYQFFWDAKYKPYKAKFPHLNSDEISEIVNDEWQDIQRKPVKWPFNKLMKEDAE